MEISEKLRVAAEGNGPAGRRWIRDLPDLLDSLAADWDLEIGPSLTGGTVSYVTQVVLRDGTPAALKVAMPTDREVIPLLEHEVQVLTHAAGRGCVRLYNHDLTRNALLLERMGRQLHQLNLPLGPRLEVICTALQALWEVTPPAGLPTGKDKADGLAAFVARAWNDLGQPCSEEVVAHAVALAERRAAAYTPERSVLSHGDAHTWNTLEDPSSPGRFRLIDPDGLLAEPEYDLSISMREYTEDLLAGDPYRLGRDRAALLGRLTGRDPQAIWEWGLVERLANGLLWTEMGAPELGAEFIETAAQWAAGDAPS